MYNIIHHLVVVVKVIIVNNSSFVKITLHGCMDANYFNVSIAICIPNLNAYSKMAASARLAYLLQQSWYFSKIFFCSSVMDLSRSSLCLLIYSSSCCISGVLCLPSSGGMTFPRHNSFMILFMVCTSCQHTKIPQKGEESPDLF